MHSTVVYNGTKVKSGRNTLNFVCVCVLLRSFKCCFNKQLCDLLNLLSVFLSSPSYLCSSLSLSSFQASYASSDLYSLNGLSSSRNPGSAFNGYQVCMQTKARPSERHTHLPPKKTVFCCFMIAGAGQQSLKLNVYSFISHASIIVPSFFIPSCSSTGHSVSTARSFIVGLVHFQLTFFTAKPPTHLRPALLHTSMCNCI